MKLDGNLSRRVAQWVQQNPHQPFYVIVGQQTNADFETFCFVVAREGGIPVIITNVGGWKKPLSPQIQLAMRTFLPSDTVRVYEAAKMGMTSILLNRAELFVKINGGIIWTP